MLGYSTVMILVNPGNHDNVEIITGSAPCQTWDYHNYIQIFVLCRLNLQVDFFYIFQHGLRYSKFLHCQVLAETHHRTFRWPVYTVEFCFVFTKRQCWIRQIVIKIRYRIKQTILILFVLIATIMCKTENKWLSCLFSIKVYLL